MSTISRWFVVVSRKPDREDVGRELYGPYQSEAAAEEAMNRLHWFLELSSITIAESQDPQVLENEAREDPEYIRNLHA